MAAWSKTKKHPGWNWEGGGPVCHLFPAFLPASRLDIACILPRRAARRANSYPFCNPLFTAAATVKPKFRGITPDLLASPCELAWGLFSQKSGAAVPGAGCSRKSDTPGASQNGLQDAKKAGQV